MKNIILSLILFISVIIGIFFSINYINNMYKELTYINDEIEESLINKEFNKAYDSCENLKKNWEKHCKLLSLYLNDNEIDNISSEIIQLSQYIKTNNIEESLVHTQIIKFLIKQIKHFEQINIHNIF